jgi:hypothetical protein
LPHNILLHKNDTIPLLDKSVRVNVRELGPRASETALLKSLLAADFVGSCWLALYGV